MNLFQQTAAAISITMGVAQLYFVFVHVPVCAYIDARDERLNPKMRRGF